MIKTHDIHIGNYQVSTRFLATFPGKSTSFPVPTFCPPVAICKRTSLAPDLNPFIWEASLPAKSILPCHVCRPAPRQLDPSIGEEGASVENTPTGEACGQASSGGLTGLTADMRGPSLLWQCHPWAGGLGTNRKQAEQALRASPWAG